MRLAADECTALARAAEVGRLATAGGDGQPYIVPVTFALVGNRVVSAVDQKPKSTTSLRRLRNIDENPRVSLLWDRYDDDWSRLWWVRGDGLAQVVEPGSDSWAEAVGALRGKYRQYLDDPRRGPATLVEVASWSGWAYGPHGS